MYFYSFAGDIINTTIAPLGYTRSKCNSGESFF